MLCLLVTGSCGQTNHLLSLDNMIEKTSSYVFQIRSLLKNSRPGKTQCVELCAYPANTSLCVFTCIQAYLLRTSCLRSTRQLFISYTKPHAAISRTSISRWVRATLAAAGIDTRFYKPHSTRAASVSAAAAMATPLDCILKTAGWSSATTFATFYHKTIETENDYGDNVLSRARTADND